MKLEHWLKENATHPNIEKKKRGRKIIKLLPKAIIAIVLVSATSPIRLATSWSSLTPEARTATLSSIGRYLMITVPIFLVLYFILPGKRTGKTGWQHHLLQKKEDRLMEVLEQIYATTPRPAVFHDEDYRTAADELRRFKPLTAEAAQTHIDQPWFKILVLSGAIDAMNDRVIKLVSIKSIEEDREAGFDEE